MTPSSPDARPSGPATGGCLCGAIRYQVAALPDAITLCHCRDCQKAGGAGSSANLIVPSIALTLLQGQPRVFSRVVDSGNTLQRHFCGDCGSPLWSRRAHQPERTVLKVGSLDAAPAARITAHIFAASAPAWDALVPADEVFARGRPA